MDPLSNDTTDFESSTRGLADVVGEGGRYPPSSARGRRGRPPPPQSNSSTKRVLPTATRGEGQAQ